MSRAANLAGFSTSISPPSNLTVGVVTASSFVGDVTGTATGLSGSPNVSVGVITASSASFSGNVSVAGTLTYEDVTNIDSIGLVTARSGVRITNGGLIVTSGISTISGGSNFDNILTENVNIVSGKLSDNTNIDLENGMVHYFTTTETTTAIPNIRYNSSTTLNSVMSIGNAISVNIITTAAAAGYSTAITIDGSAVTENWIGGNIPSDGGSSGVDIYGYSIIKTANATFTVIANQNKTS